MGLDGMAVLLEDGFQLLFARGQHGPAVVAAALLLRILVLLDLDGGGRGPL